MFVETHAHIVKSMYDNIPEIINNSLDVNVMKIVNCSVDVSVSKEVISLSNQYNGVLYSAIGIHPENIDEVEKEDFIELEELIKNNKITAIGEIGLDFYYCKDNKEKQVIVFEMCLSLAQKYNLPVIIHSRDATRVVLNILKKYKVKGIIHCFSGSLEIALEYIKMGYYIGIGGIVTFKNSKLWEVVEKIDLSNIVLETDCPFLTPEPYRKYKNEPKYIPVIATKIAQIKGVSVEEVAEITTSNACHIFDF